MTVQTIASRASGMQMRVMLTPLAAQRDQFVVRREPAENEQDGGEQSPWNGEDERERQDVGDETDQILHRHIVIDEERQKFPENVSD